MTARATSSFVIDRWQEDPVLDDKGVRFVRTSIGKTFSGDLVGTSVGEMIMAHAGDTAAYLGFEQISATLAGRTGTFVLHHDAWHGGGGGGAAWTVLAGAGTGDLAGLRGKAEIKRHDDGSHTFVLDYELD
jgi:hypothetical protein